MTTLSKSQTPELKGALAPHVLRVIEIYKKKNYYNLVKKIPKILQEIEGIPESIVRQAVDIYEKAEDRNKPGRAPYPSYFVTVAKRLDEESRRVTNDADIFWGKTI